MPIHSFIVMRVVQIWQQNFAPLKGRVKKFDPSFFREKV